ncbi:hypothetical protein [Limosilactobacillus equigenerosi]|uniref:Uncharacterized protein n=1 Tax=Limosilactobacillus equigenerosi DSM 18793 = JCM 14505 TaxID=1423742 RepID=A0A0R1V222_9LACO|nr:hypothetical protein [Limosilactobacillus equigenerosi]KRL95995.1 hypothetical protein FC21_GL000692 [Limosilactobacillus equigenerosi DSM 18793 = JCM 14505]
MNEETPQPTRRRQDRQPATPWWKKLKLLVHRQAPSAMVDPDTTPEPVYPTREQARLANIDQARLARAAQMKVKLNIVIGILVGLIIIVYLILFLL